MKNLNELIKNSVINKTEDTKSDSTLAERIKRADKVINQTEELKKKSAKQTKNLTFTFNIDEVKIIDDQIERFLKKGKYVTKSELIRIGLKIIENLSNDDITDLIPLIVKHQRGRKVE